MEFNLIILFIIQMKRSRKEINLLTGLAETLLQERMDPNGHSLTHLKKIKNQLRKMIQSGSYNEGIMSMLLNKESFKIRQQLQKNLLMNQVKQTEYETLFLEIQFSARKKSSGQLYNEEIWLFCLESHEFCGQGSSEKESARAVVEFMEYFLSILFCSSVLPVKQKQHNKYLISYTLSISNKLPQNKKSPLFTNISSRSLSLSALNKISQIRIQFYYNEEILTKQLKETHANKINYHQVLMEISEEEFHKNFMFSRKKKDSSETIDSENASKSPVGSRKSSEEQLNQFYDEDLDMTILSANNDNATEEEEEEGEWQFQILGERSLNEDQMMMKQLEGELKKLSGLEKQYF